MKWKDNLVDYVIRQLSGDSEWKKIAERVASDSSIGIHLGVFTGPFLELVFNGEKKLESRFSVKKTSPFQKIKAGDLVILKESGGPVTGAFMAGEVKFFEHLDQEAKSQLENEFGSEIGTAHDEQFWAKREKAKFASLIEIEKVTRLPEFRSEKRDRRAWAVLR